MNIQIRNLSKTFGTLRANDAITLGFAAGQIHGVLGENGAGKSTLMKLLSGYLHPDSGEVLLDGRSTQLGSPAQALRAGVGMVHQEPLDVPAFTALENFYCGSSRATLRNRTTARSKLEELAARFGFTVGPDDQLARLTVGQRQQLEIMRLLVAGARLLILDEPTTGISAAQARALFAALKQLAAEGATILFVSHKLDEVAELCDTVCVLRAGRIQGSGQLAMPQPVDRLLSLMFGESPEREPRISQEPQHHSTAEPRTKNHPRPKSDRQATPYAWQVQNVAAHDGLVSLEALDLMIAPGAAIGLAGLEGSGQQTLLRLLAGVLRPTTGRVVVGGRDLTGTPLLHFREAGIEYLPADRLSDGVIGGLSLAEHFELLRPPSARLVDPAAAAAAAARAIAEYGIKATPKTPIAALSGGNQQRAMLALVPPDAQGLLLDQPTRGLDVGAARAVWERLSERRRNGAAIVFASADLDEILAQSDAVLVFFGGKVSRPIPRGELNFARLAELIGGVGFEAQRAVPGNQNQAQSPQLTTVEPETHHGR